MIRRSLLASLAALACAAPGVGAAAQAAPATTSAAARPAEIPRAEQIDLRAKSGRDYRIFIAKPTGDAPAGGFPVIYMLDGNSVFGTAVEASRLQARALGPVVIVAIGYPIETPLDGDRRYYDLTPKTDISSFRQRLGRDVVTGGRDEFLDFIVSQVRPLVASRYPVDPQRQTLFGHSLGGQFVLHAMFTRPGLFQTYVAGSPSIWWNERSLLQELEAFAAMPAETRNDLTLRIIVGADELGHILIDARNLVVKLPPMRVYYQEIDDESHVSMLPAAINSALRFALKPPHP